eukprot:10797186-Alexandrium_andersonii.AAC.1
MAKVQRSIDKIGVQIEPDATMRSVHGEVTPGKALRVSRAAPKGQHLMDKTALRTCSALQAL